MPEGAYARIRAMIDPMNNVILALTYQLDGQETTGMTGFFLVQP